MNKKSNLQKTNVAFTLSRTFYLRTTIMVIGVLSLLLTEQLSAQFEYWDIPDTAAPRLPFYGFDDDEFIISAAITKWALDANNNIDESLIWSWVDSIGLNMVNFNHNETTYDAMYNSSLRRDGDHRCWTIVEKVFRAGMSKEIRFYPFDSTQSPYNVWKFTSTSGGTTDTNQQELNDQGSPVREQVYENSSDIGLISSGIAINFEAGDTRTDNLNKFSRWFNPLNAYWINIAAGNREPHTYYTALVGHLFENGIATDADTIFTVALYHEMPEGKEYLDENFDTVAAGTGGAEYLVDSFAVSKAELKIGLPQLAIERYRTISHGTDLRWRMGNTSEPGPLHPNQPEGKSQAIDIRVYWTGKEKAALHTVALRDSVAELLLGSGTESDSFRTTMMSDAKRRMFGSYSGTIANLRTDIVSLEAGAEGRHVPMEFAGFAAVNRMLADTFNLPRWRVANGNPASPQLGDSLRAGHYDLAGQTFQHLSTARAIYTYEYFNHIGDTVEEFYTAKQIPSGNEYKEVFEVPHHKLPSIKQRNGGRFHMPETLDLDSVGIPAYDATLEGRIEDYEVTLQRLLFGRFDPGNHTFYSGDTVGSHDYRNFWLRGWLGHMGEAAILSRRTGRPWIPMPGPLTGVELRDGYHDPYWTYDTTIVNGEEVIDSTYIPPEYFTDTLVSHTVTESELFAVQGMELGMGARGVYYWALRGSPFVERSPNNSNFWQTVEECCWGTPGHFTRDTIQNRLTPMKLFDGRYYGPNSTDYKAEIPDFYVGWFDGYKALQSANKRLAVIGSEMQNYRWRNSYTIHFTTRWPGLQRDTLSRPLPNTEIITEVQSRSPFTSIPDSTHKTFVEMGLFDKVTDSTNGQYDPLKDKYMVYLTNRRSFRKPKYGCWSDSCGGSTVDTTVNILDTLAGTRYVSCRLNLQHPDTNAYNYWRVQEILPDVESLPHQPNTPRWTLDTIVSGDSVFSLVLGPGKSTLLSITPALPDTTMIAGDLRFPGQKKIIWDGTRYHAIYSRARQLQGGGGTDNVIEWRASYPMTDSGGAIVWYPTPTIISDAVMPGDSARTDNRFPSMTLNRIADTTFITATWSCHPPQFNPPDDREIVMRNLRVVDVVQPYPLSATIASVWSNIETVDWHAGTDAEQWGTPVVGYTHGGMHFAWSDSVLGIVGRLHTLDLSNFVWTTFPSTFSARDSISWGETQSVGFAGQYPSLPPYTPLRRTDSTIGITWRQPRLFGAHIYYNRLRHTATNTMVNLNASGLSIAPWNAERWYPSIDIIPDSTGIDHREGITWEDDFQTLKAIYFQSLLTPGTGATNLTNRAYYIALIDDSVTSWPNGELFPQTAVLGEHDTSAAGSGKIQFAVSYQVPESPSELWQALVDWGEPTFRSGWPQQYSYGGKHPNVASNVEERWQRNTILYQANNLGGTDSTLRTSRQFFAKYSRPKGYAADGRDVRFRIDDSTGTGFQVLLFDPWYADANNAAGLGMSKRDSTLFVVDSIHQLEKLFRTQDFSTSDSVTVGCRLMTRFFGDSILAGGSSVDLIVEIVDSVTGDVVGELDSVRVSNQEVGRLLMLEQTYDLLLGTYYLRLRFESLEFPSDSVEYDCLYPVAEVSGWIPNPLASKVVRRLEGSAGSSMRVSAQPNPFRGKTELRFSISEPEHVSLSVYDIYGKKVERLIGEKLYAPGRYAVEFSSTGLPPGTYLIELKTYNERVTEKVVVQ